MNKIICRCIKWPYNNNVFIPGNIYVAKYKEIFGWSITDEMEQTHMVKYLPTGTFTVIVEKILYEGKTESELKEKGFIF